jgi:molybdopterin/thiamine biosynthesis adenylyltransferase
MTLFSRQAFLGSDSEAIHTAARIGIVGLGGGGSHMAQQLAHVGIGNFVFVDPQAIDGSNTNRLVGATLNDVAEETPKVAIAERLVKALRPSSDVEPLQRDWRVVMPDLRSCDIIVGAVDKLATKDELERFARANMIPYIDVGMTVTAVQGRHLISGQVIRSMPGHRCMHCLGFITPDKLEVEAKRYGDAGQNPQVVWSNGVLASAAVGLVVDLLTPWCEMEPLVYLTYDGNKGIMKPSGILEHVRSFPCPHHPTSELGEPRFRLPPDYLASQDRSY